MKKEVVYNLIDEIHKIISHLHEIEGRLRDELETGKYEKKEKEAS